MFETNKSAEIEIPPIFCSHDVQHWSYVRFRLHIPWFHVEFSFRISEEGSLRNMLFLTKVDHLLQMSQESDVEIIEVDIVVPRHMSGKECWAMEPLREIWRGIEPETDGQYAHIFVTRDSNRYFLAGVCDTETELENKELIYVAPLNNAQKQR